MHKILGKSPTISIIEWLIANQTYDHSMKEIAEGTELSMSVAKHGFEPLQKHGVVKENRTVGRDQMYVLDLYNPCAKAIIAFDVKMSECGKTGE